MVVKRIFNRTMSAIPPETAISMPLLSRVATGSRPSRLEEDVVALFDRFRGPLLRYLLACRVPIPEAEEIVQETFLALFQHLRAGKSRANLPGWIFRVAHNLALKQMARAQRIAPSLPETHPDLAPGPEELASDQQRQQRLLAVLHALPEQDQCCLALRAEGLRYREIAEVLGVSLGTVANSLARSLARLNRADEFGGTNAPR
jgi:RNA polymerase sigma-70 factor (ECF subfamily)